METKPPEHSPGAPLNKRAGTRPPWLKVRVPVNLDQLPVTKLVGDLALNTVCQEARCPNLFECWGAGTATFMILGDICTRRCTFCAVGRGVPRDVENDEPERVATAVERMAVKHAVITLIRVEILLTLTGGFSVIFLLLMASVGMPDLLFSAMAHSLIVVIGILTGFEIPLLIEMRAQEKEHTEQVVLGVDYLGAFTGTVVFAFVFYPTIGLIPTAFFVALLNALVGICLYTQRFKVVQERRRQLNVLLGVQATLFVVLAVLIQAADTVNEMFLRVYLGS